MSVTVVGSLNEDLVVTVEHLPGRGETVIGTVSTTAPGGKGANQAAAAARLGPGVALVGRVGDDPAGARMLAAATGVDVRAVRTTAGVPTGTATIPVEAGSGENLIVVSPGANGAVTAADVDVPVVRTADVLLAQLEIPLPAVLAAARVTTGTVVLNPAPPRPLPPELLDLVDVLVPNEHELLRLVGAPAGARTPAELVALTGTLVSPRRTVVVTVGGRGALIVPAGGGPALLQPPPPVTAVDTTGAGDCFCGALAWALAEGRPLVGAVRFAVAAAAASTTGAGARSALPSAADVDALLPQVPPAVPVAVAAQPVESSTTTSA